MIQRIVLPSIAWMCAGASLAPAPTGPPALPLAAEFTPALRLNQIQVLGTHNSYHIAPRSRLLSLFSQVAGQWQYTHLALGLQLDLGIRQIELDVYADPHGGLYANPLGALGEEFANGSDLERPGFKVLHVPDIDYESTCSSFKICLQQVRDWSDAHPSHLPLCVLVEAKDRGLSDRLGLDFTEPFPIGSAEMDALDAEIRSIFPPDRMITPDDVRGERDTLEEAVLAGDWPTLAESRGKVLFALDNPGRERVLYARGHPSLRGRVLFVDAPPGTPEAAFIKQNNPLGNEARIRALVERGYLVRTRADADTMEAREGETDRREAALSSGAHFISTDYPLPDPSFDTGYAVSLPGDRPARCNPVNAPADCIRRLEAEEETAAALENGSSEAGR